MKNFLFILLAFIFPVLVNAQVHPGFSKLFRYSADTIPRAETITALHYDTTNNKIYFALQEQTFFLNSGGCVLYKTGLSGEVEKEILHTVDSTFLSYYAIIGSNDSKYLYWGGISFQNKDSASSQWRLCKTDKELNIIWEKDYVLNTRGGSILTIKTIAGSEDIMLLGSKYTEEGNNAGFPILPNKIYLTRVDSAGNILAEYTPGPAHHNNGNDMAVTDDGNYLIAGRTFSWGQTNGSAYALKTDGNMDEDWHQVYNQGVYTEWTKRITRSKENSENYYITGQLLTSSATPGKGFVYKIDENGNSIWNKSLTNSADWSHAFAGLVSTGEGGCVAAGNSSFHNNKSHSPRGWLVKLDKDGNEKWNKIVTANPREGDHEYLYNIVALPDGSFMAAGSSMGQDSYGRWTSDGWLVRVDSNGCMDPACLNGGVGIKDKSKTAATISIYPNPTNGTVYLSAQTPFATGTTVRLLNNMGSTIKELPAPKGSNMQYDLDGVAAGIYYLEVNNGGSKEVKKITIHH